MEAFGSGRPLVFDTSAWVRQAAPAAVQRWRQALADGLLSTCPVVALELLATARDESAARSLDRALSELLQAPVTRAACDAALTVSRELGSDRRIPAADYLIAAAAAERSFGVLHYDHHFDVLCGALGIESVWLAAPGLLD